LAVSKSYKTFVIEQLNRAIPPIRARSMFGGVGLYSGDVFFALISQDVLYVKAAEADRAAFESLGMPPFRAFDEHGAVMSYYQLPEEVLEDPEELRRWAERSIASAREKKSKRRRR
jgi:DNA transformation protein